MGRKANLYLLFPQPSLHSPFILEDESEARDHNALFEKHMMRALKDIRYRRYLAFQAASNPSEPTCLQTLFNIARSAGQFYGLLLLGRVPKEKSHKPGEIIAPQDYDPDFEPLTRDINAASVEADMKQAFFAALRAFAINPAQLPAFQQQYLTAKMAPE